MKRFLRYFFYREVYRWIRNAGKDSNSDANGQRDPATQRSRDDIPVSDGPIETPGELKTLLQQMDPYDFEHFIADLWTRMGWETEVSSAAMDEGVDVVARKTSPYDQTTLIQAKRYGPNSTVGSPDIQQYASLSHQYDGVDKVVIVTTNQFTSQARDLADRLNVKLINGDDLTQLIADNDAADLVAEYLPFVETTDKHTENTSETPDSATNEAVKPDHTTDRSEPASDRSETVVGPLPTTRSQYVIAAAIPGWLIAFFGVNTLPETVWGILFFAVWFGLPIALYLDARSTRKHVNWPSRTWAYVLTSFIWLLAVIPAGIYLWRRRQHAATTPATVDESRAPVETPDTAGDASNRSDSTAAADVSPPDTDTAETTDSEARADATPPQATSSATSNAPGENVDSDHVGITRRNNGWADVTYAGEQHYTQTVTSPNEQFVAAYKDGTPSHAGDSNPGRVFLFEGENFRFTTQIERPNACAVADDGTVAIVDWTQDQTDELSGVLHILTPNGRQILTHEFDANLGPVSITSDGQYAATSTFNPDCTTYVFNITTGELTVTHANQHGNVQQLTFTEHAGERMLRLGDPDDIAYGIDLAGHNTWKSDALKRRDRMERLIQRSKDADFGTRIDLLNDALTLAVEDHERRNIARELADAHWTYAKTLDNGTDEWLTHLDHAATHYEQTLPWYDGKQGLAKVRRKQGTHHLKTGADAAARECFNAIATLEDEYDVSLLTDADKRRLEDFQ